MITGLHTADWHHTDAVEDSTQPALDFMAQQVELLKPDFVAVPGDLIMKRGYITPTESLIIRETILRFAEVCPTIVIPGNHDMSNRYDRVDAVRGILDREDGLATIHPNLYVSSRPDRIDIEIKGRMFRFYTLPHPSKYIYLSQNTDIDPSLVDETITKKMEQICLGIATDVAALPSNWTPVMLAHGTVSGGVADSEAVLTNENDLAIDRTWLPEIQAIMYGHLHKRQQVGRAFYCGQPAPLTFAQEKIEPSCEVWEFDDSGEVNHHPLMIPVAHQMFTIDIEADRFTDGVDPKQVVMDEIAKHSMTDAKVRLRIEIPQERRSFIDKTEIEKHLGSLGAHDKKVVIESIAPLKIRAENMEQGSGMSSMLEKWAELDDDRTASLDLMKQIEETVKADIPHEDLHDLVGTEYWVTRIRARNFKPLIDVDLVFSKLGKVICIIGPNHIGKSQIGEIERFALHKVLRKGGTLADAIRKGTDSAIVEEWFSTREGNFKVERTLKRSKSGTASGEVILSKEVEENGVMKYRPMNEGTSGETQAAIVKKVGTYEMYQATRFGSQGNIDLLCNMGPAELTNTLQEAMNFNSFDLREKAAKKQLDILNKKYEHAKMELENLKTQLLEEDNIRESLGHLEETKKQKAVEVESLQTQLAQAQVDYNNASKTQSELKVVNETIGSLTGKLAAENSTITYNETLLGQSDAAKNGLEFIKISQEKHDNNHLDLSTISADISTHSSKIHELESDLATRREAGTVNSNRRTTLHTEVQNLLTARRNEVAALEDRIKTRKTAAELTTEVPCNGMDIQSECKLLSNANTAKTELVDLEQQLSNLKPEDTSAQDKEIGELQVEMNNMTKEAEVVKESIKTEGATKEAAQLKYNTLKTESDSLLQKITDEKAHHWGEIQEKILVANANIDNARKNVVSLTESLQTENNKKDAFVVIDSNQLQTKVDSLKSGVTGILSQQENTIRQIGVLENNLKAIEKIKTEITEMEELNKDGLSQIAAYNYYIAAVSRNGIPYLLMEKALPKFEKYANQFLCVNEGFEQTLRVQISSVKDTQKGESKDEIVISFVDDRGTHPLSESSGFQRVAIGYSLRASMAKVQGESTGTVIRHCFYDEGWGTFDSESLMLGRRMIEKLADEFGQFFYITHVPVLQEVADTIIEVVAVDSGAAIKIAA